MRRADHLSEVDWIRFLDDEMSPEESSLAESHLKQCGECSAGLAEARSIVEGMKGIEPLVDAAAITDAPAARASLKAKLVQARGISPVSPGESVRAFVRKRPLPDLSYATVAAAGIAVIFLLAPGLHHSMAEIAVSLPNHALTPGMTRTVDVGQMCAEGDDDLDPAVPYPTQKAVFSEYGMSIDHSAKDFQVDYLISPQLGGTDDVRNLWPQSYKSTAWNAVAKDRLERHLYQMVCEKKINLADAQRDIATNWIAAYQKYFGTRLPV